MENSRVYVDTVYKTTLKINNKIIFNYLDNSYVDTLNIEKTIGKKYNLILKDTLEYFFLANLTNKAISIRKLHDHLVAEEYSRFENFGYKPISYFIYPFCASGVDYPDGDLILKPKEVLIIKNLDKRDRHKVKSYSNVIMKLLTNTGGSLLSMPYSKSFDSNRFFILEKYKKDFINEETQLAFPYK